MCPLGVMAIEAQETFPRAEDFDRNITKPRPGTSGQAPVAGTPMQGSPRALKLGASIPALGAKLKPLLLVPLAKVLSFGAPLPNPMLAIIWLPRGRTGSPATYAPP